MKFLKVLTCALLFVGFATARPPRLKWQKGNCYLLGDLCVLWSMSELTRWALEALAQDQKIIGIRKIQKLALSEKQKLVLPPDSFERSYAELLKAIADGMGDATNEQKQDFWAAQLAPVQTAMEKLVELHEVGVYFANLANSRLPGSGQKEKYSGAFGEQILDLIHLYDRPVGDDDPKKGEASRKCYYVLLDSGSLPVSAKTSDVRKIAQEIFRGTLDLDAKMKPARYILLNGRSFVQKFDVRKEKIWIPLSFDTAAILDPGLFDVCEYELATIVVDKNKNHTTVYAKDFDEHSWYFCDDYSKQYHKVADEVIVNNSDLWGVGNVPALILYKRVKLVLKTDPLGDALRRLSGSLTQLAGQMGKSK